VSKLARDHGVVVCHVGEGADELFFGYPGWKRLLDIQNLCNQPVPSLVWRMGVLGLRCAGKGQSLPCEWIRRASRGGPVFWGGEEAFSETKKSWLLSSRMRRECAGRSSWEVLAPIYSRFLEHASDPNPMNWMTYLDLNFRLPELLLMRVDKMSMGVSLEGRVPFLDHKLIELAMGIPPEMKIREGKLKYILKKAVRGHVPDALLDRAKQGFGVPVYEWFMDRLGTYAQSHLEYFCQQTDYLDRHAIQTLFDQKRGKDIWYLLNVALWWKYYIAGEEL
jgi:asparagine synthase (glutamine-hydrolysing)